MATLADYIVLSDASFEINASFPTTKDLNFDLNNDFITGTKLAKPILAFIINPLTTDANVSITVSSGPVGSEGFPQKQDTISTLRFSGELSHDQGLWEAFSGKLLTPNEPNTITFEVTAGRVRVRDVVLWYQRRS
ncbi:MAG: hypothetical protein AAGB19_19695 [Cyanobacteria bacterium P01_F01_bin.3]